MYDIKPGCKNVYNECNNDERDEKEVKISVSIHSNPLPFPPFVLQKRGTKTKNMTDDRSVTSDKRDTTNLTMRNSMRRR